MLTIAPTTRQPKTIFNVEDYELKTSIGCPGKVPLLIIAEGIVNRLSEEGLGPLLKQTAPEALTLAPGADVLR